MLAHSPRHRLITSRRLLLALGAVGWLAMPAERAVAQTGGRHGGDSTATMPGMGEMPGMPRAPRDTAPHATPSTMSMPMEVLDIPMQRRGSGTTWLPDATPMYGAHSTLGGWDVMLHGVAFLEYDDQGSPRGGTQIGSVNWGMAMASREMRGGLLSLSTMLSAEPFTVGAGGYPLLLQSGEAYHGAPLHDRQHPHDLFMELAAQYDHAVARNVVAFVYVAPVGEPALGPVAFPHRPSAADDPLAPIGHHWQDATHVSFGVITAGVFTRMVRLEGSIFNGREPDENRTNFDYRGRSLDSYAARATVNPGERWSMSASYGFLKSPEQLAPTVSEHRFTASVLYGRPIGVAGHWASTLVYGGNAWAADPRIASSYLAESEIDLDGRNTVFGRGEIVDKSGDDLSIGTGSARYTVGELTLGYVREIASVSGGSLGVGAAGTVNVVPAALGPTYGTRTPLGATVFLRVRPGRMAMSGAMRSMPGMSGMPGMSSGTITPRAAPSR